MTKKKKVTETSCGPTCPCDKRSFVSIAQRIFDTIELPQDLYDELALLLMPRGVPGTGQVCGNANDCTRLKGHEGTTHYNHYKRQLW